MRQRRGRKLRHLHIKVRLVRWGRTKPTHEEMAEAIDYLLEHNEPPRGWEFHGMNYDPDYKGERVGGLDDIQALRNVLLAWRDNFSAAVVQVRA